MDQDIMHFLRESFKAFNASDITRFRNTIADAVDYHEYTTQRHVRSGDELVNIWQGWRQYFPDIKADIRNIFVSGKQAAIEVTWVGTHSGAPWGSTPPSGKPVQLPAVFVVAVERGKMTEVRGYTNLLTLLEQIGAAPEGYSH